MNRIFSLIVILFFVFIENNYGQEYDRCWPLGEDFWVIPNKQNNLVFTSNGVRVDTVIRDIKIGPTCASISDFNGNMLFFTNGCVVANRTNDTMPNGDNLNPGPCPQSTCSNSGNALTQGSLIIPEPGNINRFLLFHEACNYSTNLSPITLFLSKIDLSLNLGQGDVINKNNIIYQDTLCDGSLTAVKHANGTDWWVMVHEKYNNNFVRFLVTPAGIFGPYFQSIGLAYTDDGHGTSRFSPDGNWYATSTQLGGVDLFRFNRCNGLLSAWTNLDFPDSMWVNCVSFSPNSKVLYLNYLTSITQFDLTATDISASRQIVATYDGFMFFNSGTVFWFPQLGPDGKIYISTPGTTYLHVIDQPDSLGIACNVLQHSILTPLSINGTVPNFPNYRLGPVDSTYCDSLSAVEDLQMNESAVLIFPNPASENISIRCEKRNEQVRDVFVFDSIGKMISDLKISENTIDVRDFVEGIYFVIIETNRGRYFKKVMVAR
jgi:hypothetical protein